MAIFMMINGSFVSIGTNISAIYGNPKLHGGAFGPSQISLIAGSSTILGIVSAFGFGYALKATHKNLLLLKVCVFGSFLGLCIGAYILYTGNVASIYLISFLISMLQIPAVPMTINFASEITFPQEATVITGFLLMSSRLSGFIMAIITTAFTRYGSAAALGFLSFCNLGSSITILFLKEDLKKYNFS